MPTVEFIIALEQRMELVPLRRGWWVAFGAPRQTAPAPSTTPQPASTEVLASTPGETTDAPAAGGDERRTLGRQRQRAGTVPPEPGRRDRRQPQPPSPRPMPDPAPAPAPVPEPPGTPDQPPTPRSGRRGRH